MRDPDARRFSCRPRGAAAPADRPLRPALVAAGLVGLSLLLGPVDAAAQEEWQWPESPENLEVLEGFSGRQLRGVMTGFTRALGVRCAHCHVGEDGQPLSTFDFAADDKPAKVTARRMLLMLGDIGDHLEEIEPSGDRVNMWCHTCHRGRPRPMTLAEELKEAFGAGGADAVVSTYRDLRERFHGRGAYDFGPGSLNGLGYSLLQSGDAEAAITVFRLNVEQFPDAANPHDSLGEAYRAAGEREKAIASFRRALELDPEHRSAARNLRELETDAGAAGDPSAPGEPAG